MDNATQGATLLIVLVIFVVNAIVRRREFVQRPIALFDALPVLEANSIETGKPVHLSFGNAGIGDRDTLLALANADFFYSIARSVGVGDAPPIVSVSNATTLQVARDMLRRAHRDSQASTEFRPFNVRWFPDEPVAFAGALSAMTRDDRLSSHILAGNGGAEIALILWSAERGNATSMATSTRLTGQSVAYAMADYTLIGEEIFAAPGYVTPGSSLRNRTIVMDLTRWLAITVILIAFILNLAGR